MLFAFAGQVAGNVISGSLSNYLQSRKKVIFLFMSISFAIMVSFLLLPVQRTTLFYVFCAFLGFSSGYWTLFITVAAELFGSNLRATVATTVPNFVRGTVIPLTSVFVLLKASMGTIQSALAVGIGSYALAIIALVFLEETFKKDINTIESD